MLSTAALQIHIDLNTMNILPVEPTSCPYYDGQEFFTKAIAACNEIVGLKYYSNASALSMLVPMPY
ncbi:21657_t:CDS:2, partial [Dentiscutata erythropus]